MKTKTSVTLSPSLLAGIDKHADALKQEAEDILGYQVPTRGEGSYTAAIRLGRFSQPRIARNHVFNGRPGPGSGPERTLTVKE